MVVERAFCYHHSRKNSSSSIEGSLVTSGSLLEDDLLDTVARLSVDCRQGVVVVGLVDGREFVGRLGAAFPASSATARMTWDVKGEMLLLETSAGECVIAELPSVGREVRDARPVIYLDQNHWSTLAKVRHDPRRAPPREVAPARRLLALAEDRVVRLPISAGHVSETGKWTRQPDRYRLALTMLDLSGGWQMRDPLDVRRLEIRDVYRRRFDAASGDTYREVFTLEPNAIFGDSRDGTLPASHSPTLPKQAFMLRALSAFCALFDLMLDSEPVVLGDASRWVEKVQRWSHWLANEPRDPERRRQRTSALFLDDLSTEFFEEMHGASITPETWRDWWEHEADRDIRAMPALGLYREAFREKLLEPGTRWSANDLVDLIYLTCGAGYADHTVGENSLVSALERSLKRLGRPITVHRRLEDLVRFLDV